jgi:hypothetical protein
MTNQYFQNCDLTGCQFYRFGKEYIFHVPPKHPDRFIIRRDLLDMGLIEEKDMLQIHFVIKPTAEQFDILNSAFGIEF